MNGSATPVLVPFSQIKGGTEKLYSYNPFPWYERMRKESPVYYDEKAKVWNVFLYDDVKRVLDDKEYFSSKSRGIPGSSLGKSLINTDPPQHTDLRSIVNRAFTPRVMKEWEPRIHEITQRLLDRVSGREHIDVVMDFSHPLPVVVISELLGVPPKYIDKFKEWSDIIVTSPKSNNKEDIEEVIKIKLKAEKELEEFFQNIIDEKRKNLGNDLISILIRAEDEGVKISKEQLIPFCNLLLVAGNETTTNLISNALYSIIENHGVYEELRNNLSLVPQMVEEVLRYRSPAQVLRRVIAKETEIGGHKLQKGEVIIPWLGSANRDENKFENASQFDIHRNPNHHIAFGHGIHFCLGAPLARLEANIAMTELIKRYSSITLLQGFTVDPIEDSAVYGLKSFPVIVRG
jgi:cytochrome P450 family 109